MMQTASKGTLWRIGALFGIALLSTTTFSTSVGAQENSAPATARPPSVAPYDSRLQRLSEVLGSIHYLRNLCGETSNQWRDQMEGLLAVEKPTPNRRARLIAEFNKGYRSFNSVYTTCTPQALTAVDRYMNEGKALAGEINSRYAE
ncbi:MAG: TIGR02301 family protein [Pseudomonadota bacterium]